MMVKTRGKSIPVESSPRSLRVAVSVNAAGHSSKNGLQNPGSAVEQLEQRTAELLEGQSQRKKRSTSQNKEVVKCHQNVDFNNECVSYG